MTSLHDLYDALTAGSLRPENSIAATAALDLVAHLYNLPLAALDLEAPRFAQVFPRDQIPEIARPIFGADLLRYRAFRNSILDCQMLALPGDVDGEPRHSLLRLARLCLGDSAYALFAVAGALPAGVAPSAITRELALSIDSAIEDHRKQGFRRGLSILDRLREFDLARRSGLLPPARIGRLPTVRDHVHFEPLPHTLLGLRTAAPRPTQNAIDYLWRLAVAGDVFRRGDDPSLDEVAARIPEMARLDPAALGLAISDPARKKYLRAFIKSLVDAGCVDPQASSPRVLWRRLKAALRATGGDPERLKGVARPAVRDGLGPHEVTPDWCARTLARLDRVAANAFRTSAYLLDALREDDRIPAALLPEEETGLTRLVRPRGSPKPAPRPKAPEVPCVIAWKRLFAEARAQGFDNRTLGPLSTLRVRAIRADLSPRDLDADWIVDLLNRETLGNRAAIHGSTRLLDAFGSHPVLGRLVPTKRLASDVLARRCDRRPLSKGVTAELAETMDRMGMQASGRRETAAAAKALAEVSGPRPTLGALLAQDFDALDWSPFTGRSAAYKRALNRVRVFLNLPWTNGWLALQGAVLKAGVPMRENPVPRLLPHAQGREPVELDATWAADTDRFLRSTILHPPYGRADLALTFASNIRRLDRLHDVASIVASGVLPPPIGDFRPRIDSRDSNEA